MRKVAEESGYSLDEIHKSGEQMSKATNFMNNFLNTMDAYVSSIDAIHNAEIEVIKKLAQNPCILIGRCADRCCGKRESPVSIFSCTRIWPTEWPMPRN